MKLYLREEGGQLVLSCPTSTRDRKGALVVVRPAVLMRQLEFIFGEGNVRMSSGFSPGRYEYVVPEIELEEEIPWLYKAGDSWKVKRVRSRDLFTGEPFPQLSDDEMLDAIDAMQQAVDMLRIEVSLRKIKEGLDAADQALP